MRKFQKLMLSHRCVCMCADLHPHAYEQQLKSDLHPHAYQQQLKWTRKQKKLTGFFKKNSHPQETTEIPCLPPQPPTSMLWSEVPSIINRKGCFFWRPPNTKFRRQHWIGGRGGAWPLWCGTSWDGCFFWRTRYDYWLVVSTPLENISQLGLLFPIYRKIKNVPNHQAD